MTDAQLMWLGGVILVASVPCTSDTSRKGQLIIGILFMLTGAIAMGFKL